MIARAGRRMRVLSVLTLVWSATHVAAVALNVAAARPIAWRPALEHAVAAVLSCCFAVMLRPAAVALQQITTTEGRDVAHLMAALGALARVYRGQATVVAVAVLGSVAALVATFH